MHIHLLKYRTMKIVFYILILLKLLKEVETKIQQTGPFIGWDIKTEYVVFSDVCFGEAILNELMANANMANSCGKCISVLRRKMWTEHLVDKCFLCKQKDPSSIPWIYIFIHGKNRQQKSHRDGLFLVSTGKTETEELLGLLNNDFN